MGDKDENIIGNSSILLSRNTPVAFVVGVAGFIGSHLAEAFLDKGVQVIGLDDFSVGKRENISHLIKNKHFHLIDQSVTGSKPGSIVGSFLKTKLPRLDYAFFVVSQNGKDDVYGLGLRNFLDFIKMQRECMQEDKRNVNDKPRVVLVSSIALYDGELSDEFVDLKNAEICFARFAKDSKVNARVVRLAAVYGPRMRFDGDDPIVKLLYAAVREELPKEHIALDFTTRALFIDDAVHLLLKTVLSGATAQKIYDGALLHPARISEIKQILLDPLWYERTSFKPTFMPSWPTPNLVKTMKELSWKPREDMVATLKETLAYFKENHVLIINKAENPLIEADKRWSFETAEGFSLLDQTEEGFKSLNKAVLGRNKVGEVWKILAVVAAFVVIGYALFYPVARLAYGAFVIQNYLTDSKKSFKEGDFKSALEGTSGMKQTLGEIDSIVGPLSLFGGIPILGEYILWLEEVISLADSGVEALDHAILGTETMFKAVRVISGERADDPRFLYIKAQSEFTAASDGFSKIMIVLDNPRFLRYFPRVLGYRMDGLRENLEFYNGIVQKLKAAAFLLPHMTAIDGKKEYLVLIQNNLELRSGGGFIGSYGKLTFENGRIKDIVVDDIYNLDGFLKERIDPPSEIKDDLGQKNWYLRDSNTEPDFPTSARQAEFFYLKEAGSKVDGVVAFDLSASSMILSGLGGLTLPDYGEEVTADNLFEKIIAHTEAGFFPGSQAKKNYLTQLQTQLFNKIFFLPDQNWAAIVAGLGEALEQKHVMLYLSDPTLFSFVSSQNWGGVLPKESEKLEGQTHDFLSVVESNVGANKANYYLTREFRLDSKIASSGAVLHRLKVDYANSSVSDEFPGGRYRARLKLYLPFGASLIKATFGESDITQKVNPFSDYGRAVFSMLLEVYPKEKKSLVIDYKLAAPFQFKDGKVEYKMDVVKQPGTVKDAFSWSLMYPGEMRPVFRLGGFYGGAGEAKVSFDLAKDRSFLVDFYK